MMLNSKAEGKFFTRGVTHDMAWGKNEISMGKFLPVEVIIRHGQTATVDHSLLVAGEGSQHR